ncbi:hypothetical protein Gogos_004119, partial [Gossypium gossypioides]|nr:hypothetical protein [Gossypium gossypioides]
KVARELDQVVEEWLREHKEKRAENEANSEEDFMGVMLSILRNARSMMSISSTKPSVTMTWVLSLLLNNREALHKVKQELDIHVETLHLYPVAPLVVIHEAIEDCSVCGYDISVGTWLILNLQKIQRDSKI